MKYESYGIRMVTVKRPSNGSKQHCLIIPRGFMRKAGLEDNEDVVVHVVQTSHRQLRLTFLSTEPMKEFLEKRANYLEAGEDVKRVEDTWGIKVLGKAHFRRIPIYVMEDNSYVLLARGTVPAAKFGTLDQAQRYIAWEYAATTREIEQGYYNPK